VVVISKIFWSHHSVDEVLLTLQENGLVIFADTKIGFTNFYKEKLLPVLPEQGIRQDYTNHPTEGYFYFLYDSNVYSREQAINIILKFRS
jgi:hypothetical protein